METQVQIDQLEELATHIELRQADLVSSHSITLGELTLEATASDIPALVEFLKSDEQCRFASLVDITAIDRVKVRVREEEIVPSITGIHPSANWFEREVFDMFGILFSDHPDLRRILTDYGFRGYPLRKDFPTTGYTEVRYDEVQKRVVYEPVSLTQEYRQFDFMSPWEGAEYVLPGDEKKTGEAK